MDYIYFNGIIVTLDRYVPRCEAIAIKNGIIVRVGNNKDILALATDDTKKVDLLGRLTLPGFIDSHLHLIAYANSMHDTVPVGTIPSIAQIKSHILFGCEKLLTMGITACHTDDFMTYTTNNYDSIIRAYSDLSMDNTLPIRINQQCHFNDIDSFKAFLDKGHRTGNQNGFYRIGPVKLVVDGFLENRKAFLRTPYNDDDTTSGEVYYSADELNEIVQLAHDSNMQIATHAIGDAAIIMILNAYENASLNNPKIDTRHGIIHALVTDNDLLTRIQALGVITYVQPVFVRLDNHIVDCRVGSDIARTSLNWRTMIDKGIHASGGSDSPDESLNVMENMYCAITRKDFDNWPEYGWYPENSIAIDEAIRMFTTEGAYAAHKENSLGVLSVGKYADMVVLEKNIYDLSPEDIKNVEIAMTIVNGEIKYKK